MGRVYKVHHRAWDMDLALKRPLASTLQTEEGRDAYIREAETWVNLGLHPHIVCCYYIREIDGLPCLFAECVEGGTLAHWIGDGKLYEGSESEVLARILDCAIQFAWGVGYAHENGLVHQDLKPTNVLLTQDGVAKVTDFGLAQAVALARSDAQNLACTPEFASPEQLEGGAITFASDVWSWGLCVLCMFTREVPPWGNMAPMLLEGYIENGPTQPGTPRMPDELGEILRHCFSTVKEQRPRNLAEAVSVLIELYEVHSGRPYPRHRPGTTSLAADGLNNKAISLMDLGFAEEAEARLEDALEADPRNLAATYNLGLARWRRGELTDEELLRALTDLRTVHANSWEAAYLLAWVHLERADTDAARRFAADALRLAGDDESAFRQIEHLRHSIRSGFTLHGSCEGHGDIIRSICLTDDGAIAVTGGADGTVRLWDVGGRQHLRTMTGHRDEVTGVALASQVLMLASSSMDATVRVWDPQSGTVRKALEGHRGPVRGVVISQTGLLMVTAGEDSTVRSWRAREGDRGLTFGPPKMDTRRPTMPGEGPPRFDTRRPGSEGPPPRFDSRKILTSATRKIGMEWGMHQVMRGHEGPVLSIALTSDDRYVISGGQDGQILLWDLETGNVLTKGETDGVPQNFLALRYDSLIVAGPGRDNTIRLYDMSEGACVRELIGHTAAVEAVTFASTFLLSVSRDKTVRVWEATGRCRRTLDVQGGWLHAVAATDDASWIACGGADRALVLWKAPDTLVTAPYQVSMPRSSVEVMVHQEGYAAAIAEAYQGTQSGDWPKAINAVRKARACQGFERDPEVLRLWEQLAPVGRRGQFQAAWPGHAFAAHHGSIGAIAMSPDARVLLTGGEDGSLRLFDVSSGEQVWAVNAHQDGVRTVSMSAPGHLAVSIGRTGTRRVWRLPDAALISTTPQQGSVAMSEDGRIIAALDRGSLRFVETETSNVVHSIPGIGTEVALSADARLAVTAGNDGTVYVHDIRSRQCIRRMKGHTEPVRGIALSRDARRVLTCADDATLRLWDVETGKPVHVLEGHSRPVWATAMTPDGLVAVSASKDRQVGVWDLETGSLRAMLEGHQDWAMAIALSHDGRLAVSAGKDGEIRFWHLDFDLLPPPASEWDEAARPCLTAFLSWCVSRNMGTPLVEGIWSGIPGPPTWDNDDFNLLMWQLGTWGFGWIAPARVHQELESMAHAWAA